jgi:hypothetical protein
MSPASDSEPAVKSYVFDQGFKDLKKITAALWAKTVFNSSHFFSSSSDSGLGTAYNYLAGISVLACGAIFAAILYTILALPLISLAAIVYIFTIILAYIEHLVLKAKTFYTACPFCHNQSSLPEYLCGSCGQVHSELRPGTCGMLTHKCTCGNKLPATFFLNRGRQAARCPACHRTIKREHTESKRIFIPAAGGPSAGKTAYLFGALKEFIETKAPGLGFSAEFLESRSTSAFHNAAAPLAAGRVPAATEESIPPAVNLSLKNGSRLEHLLYFYDPAGAAFQKQEVLSGHGCFKYFSGLLFLADPFSIAAVRKQFGPKLSRFWPQIKPCELPLEETIDRLLLVLSEKFGLSKTEKVRQPLAVIFTKADVFGLDDVIDDPALKNSVFSASGSSPACLPEERNKLFTSQLIDWGEQAFVTRLENRFANCRFFSCSALGRMPDGTGAPFIGNNVLEPLMWVLSTAEPKSFPPSG